MRLLCLALAMLTGTASGAEIRGTVVNAQGGEPLGNVRVSLSDSIATRTDADGSFAFSNVAGGDYVLRIEAIGFWLQRTQVHVASPADKLEFSIALVPEGAQHKESVDVRADRFGGPDTAQSSAFTLTGPELRNAATVLAADPFRSLQALPGVTASDNNDFYAQFTVRGAAYDKVAVYLDSIQLRQPFHGIKSIKDGASVSLFSPDILESLTLSPAAFSERYADGTGGALDLRTRDGSVSRPRVLLSAGLAETHFSAEGALPAKLGSWLATGRKSYMGYLLRRNDIDPGIDVGLYDVSGKLTVNVAPRHVLDVFVLHGHTDLRQDSRGSLNALKNGDNTFTLARAGWRWSASPTLFVASNGAFVRHRYGTTNYNGDISGRDYYGEWVGATTAVWSWKKNQVLEGGYSLRRMRDRSGSVLFYPEPVPYDNANGTAVRQGGYVQQSSSLFDGRLNVMAGIRWDLIDLVRVRPVSPQASAAFRLNRSTSLQFGYGRYLQFEDMRYLARVCEIIDYNGRAFSIGGYVAFRSEHFSAGAERRIGESSRIKIEFFQRSDTPWLGYRPIEDHTCAAQYVRTPPQPFPDGDTRTRGFELTLQRRSANRLSGWISYTFARSRQYFYQDAQFPEDDQRHTLNVFGVYRLKPTVNVSGKWLYGSGYPVAPYFAPGPFPTAVAGQLRLGPYERFDVRVDKLFALKGRKVTLYGEAINLTNHRNLRVTGLGDYDPLTGRFPVLVQRAAGFIPAAGVSIEF